MDRFTEMSEQRRLIEEKKQEILNKLAEKKRKHTEQPVKHAPKKLPIESPSVKLPPVRPMANLFRNDGSFLDQFKKMHNSNDTKTEVIEDNQSSTSRQSGIIMKIQPPSIKTLQPTEAQMKLSNEEDEDKINVSSPEDKAVSLAVERVAISVAVNGGFAEEAARRSNASDAAYSFLTEPEGDTYKLFQKRVTELVEAKKRAEADGHLMTFSNTEENSSTQTRKRKKKSRWEPQDSQSDVNVMPQYVQQDPGLVSYAIQVFGSTDLSPEQWKQLEDQRKMRLLFEMMQAKQKEEELRKLTGKVKYEYDSDEETEGGTWEHKKRASEMEKTKYWAEDLTEHAKGKHHIGDFLPPEELESFMEKWDAVKEGRNPDLSDYKEYKIQSDNIGYQMLQKLGWSEGQGLGADGAGIVDPVNKGAVPVENSGLGQSRPDDIKSGDDEYEAYRKRMMLAYRFRPNPLNNPRRPYY